MKSSVSVALIVCGTLLAAMPYINAQILLSRVATAMVALQRDVNLNTTLPTWYEFTVIVIGLIMIVAGGAGAMLTSFGRGAQTQEIR